MGTEDRATIRRAPGSRKAVRGVPERDNRTTRLGRDGFRARSWLRLPRAWKRLCSLVALLMLPACALLRLSPYVALRYSAGYALFVSLICYLVYRHDKQRAQAGAWRTPERVLHLLEIAGGWPGGFLAQRILRHKNAKLSYQIPFWLIVTAYQYAAFDFLSGWKHSLQVLLFFRKCLAA